MAQRRILRLDGGAISIAKESRFESERDLHQAIAQHPEVLPSEDLALGPLVTLATELDLGHGPIDLLAADSRGRLVIVRVKRKREASRLVSSTLWGAGLAAGCSHDHAAPSRVTPQ